jgi:hypothetical protein
MYFGIDQGSQTPMRLETEFVDRVLETPTQNCILIK